VSIADVARAYRIKENHLTKVVPRLARLDLVETVRGPQGGLRLARPPAQIRVGEVVRGTEDNLAVVECFASTTCPLTGACRLELALHEALDAFLAVLDRYTLDDLLAGPPNLATRIGLSRRRRPNVPPSRR